jgi:hypothetical protein
VCECSLFCSFKSLRESVKDLVLKQNDRTEVVIYLIEMKAPHLIMQFPEI